ncbi:MAG: hypothetical protein NVS9B14_08990 [Candidatus Acidiferrum sp.]
MIAGRGDFIPVSALPIDGMFRTATSLWEKRNIAQQIPVWDEELCIQCGKCVLVCPHAVIRAKVYDSSKLAGAPTTFKSAKPRWRELETLRYTLQVSPEDCTGCRLCVEICPAKSKSEVKHKAINMAPHSSSPTAIASRTVTTSPSDWSNKKRPSSPDIGRSCVTTPTCAAKAKIHSNWIPALLRCP